MPLYRLTNGVEVWAHCECTRADRRILRQYREQCSAWGRLCVEIGREFIAIQSDSFFWDAVVIDRVMRVLQTEPCIQTRNLLFTNRGLKVVKIRRYSDKGEWKNVWSFVARLAKAMQHWKAACWREDWPEEFE